MTEPSPQDLQNVSQLLAFFQNSFRGAKVGLLEMDSATNSLETLLKYAKEQLNNKETE